MSVEPALQPALRRPRRHLIATEFIFSDPLPASTVHVTGSWDDWRIHPMDLQEPFVWHVVLNLPRGTYRFRFLVDGKPTLSSRHPLSDSIAHIRTVHGPKHNRTRKVPKRAYDGVLWALRRMGMVDQSNPHFAHDQNQQHLLGENPPQGWPVWMWIVLALVAYIAVLALWYAIRWALGEL